MSAYENKGRSASFTPQRPAPRYTYHHIFSDVCKTRFNQYSRGFLFKISILLITLMVFISKSSSPWTEILLEYFKVIPLMAAMLQVVITRKNYLHVDYLGYTSWISTIYGQLLSKKWAIYTFIYGIAAREIAYVFKGLFFRKFCCYSDTQNLYYSIFLYYIVPIVYSAQHVLLDLDRLTFNYGTQHQHPQKYMASKALDSFLKSLVLAGITSIITPILFKFNFGTFTAGFFFHLKTSSLAFVILQIYDFTNIGFDAYLSIGCLHKGNPISSLSSTPIETLLTGLRSEKKIVKLTSFQELAYRATHPKTELRKPIYYSSDKNDILWPCILMECTLVIQETNNNVSDFLVSLKNEVDPKPPKQPMSTTNSSSDYLFGTNHTIRTQSDDGSSRLPGAPPSEHRFADPPSTSSHRIVLEDANVFKNHSQKDFNTPRFTEAYKQSIFNRQPTIFSLLNELWNYLVKKVTQYLFTIDSGDSNKKKLSLFELYHISKLRESEKLCPVPVCYAECVNALMGLLVNSLDENPKGAVVSSVGDVLKLLERSIGVLGSFAELELDGKKDKNPDDIISILYDQCINAFLAIVLKYDTFLNDVYLDEDVVKLTQWLLRLSQDL